jgi:hypothetical protein
VQGIGHKLICNISAFACPGLGNSQNVNQGRSSPGQDTNLQPSEYEVGVLPT